MKAPRPRERRAGVLPTVGIIVEGDAEFAAIPLVELGRLLGREYSKTKDGPALFEALPFPEARAHGEGKRGSKSLDKLLRTLGL